jgi:predicted DNA-binding transcriptional regulator AlpA
MTAHQSAKRVLFRGQWLTAPEIAAIVGVSVRTIHRRIQLDMPLDETPPHGCPPLRYEFRGTLATIKEIMAATGLSRSQVQRRTDSARFYEADEAREQLTDFVHNSRLVFFNGVTDSVSGWARRLGMNRMTLYDRLKRGWTIKDAIMTPANTYTRKYTFKGITDTLSGWSKRTGIHVGTLKERIYMDWPIEAVLTVSPTCIGQRIRRRAILRRLLEGFHAPSSPAVTLPSPPTTGGPSKTFHPSPATGDVSHKTHLQPELLI